MDIDWGSVPDAFDAIIANINAHGGINGRHIVPYLVAVNPTGTAAAATACTQLTEDDTVFVAIAPLQATCYLQHGTPVIASLYAPGIATGPAQDFTLTPPPSAYDPVQLSVFAKQGVFKHKKVGIFAGVTSDQPEIPVVQAALAKLHVPVVTTAVDSAPEGDLPASNAQVTAIALRFQSDGVNEVVAVGDGSAVWPQGLSAIQSTYNPPWVATNESDLSGDVGGDDNPTYLKNVVTSSPLTPPPAIWNNAGTQQCVRIVKKAYPSDHINDYSPTLPESEITYMSVEILYGHGPFRRDRQGGRQGPHGLELRWSITTRTRRPSSSHPSHPPGEASGSHREPFSGDPRCGCTSEPATYLSNGVSR